MRSRNVCLLLVTCLVLPVFAARSAAPGPTGTPGGSGTGGGNGATPSALSFESDARVLGASFLAAHPGVLGRAAAGELTGDLRADVVLQLSGALVLVYGPGLYHALEHLPWNVNDFAVLSGSSPAEQGTLLTVDGQGLSCWLYEPSTQDFLRRSLGSAAWQGARRVFVGASDGLGTFDVLGLAADGRTLLRLFVQGTSAVETSWSSTEEIEALVPIEWDGSAPLELAVATSAGVHVVAADGSTNWVYGQALAGDVLCALESSGVLQQKLVVATRDAAGDQLLVFDFQGGEAPLALGDIGVVGMVAADFDQDGLEDLALTQSKTAELLLLQNQGPGASFDLESGNVLRLGDPAPLVAPRLAWPSVADFDDDGDLDVVVPGPANEDVRFHRNWQLDHERLQATVTGGSFAYDPGSSSGALELQLAPPPVLSPGADAMEVVLWRQSDPNLPTQAQCFDAEVLDLPADGIWSATLPCVLGSPELYSIEIRWGRRGASGGLVQAATSEVWSFGTDDDALEEIALLHEISFDERIALNLESPEDQPDSVGTIPLGCVPCFEDEGLPQPVPDRP